MQAADWMRQHGVMVYVKVEDVEYEVRYRFPRVPVCGEVVHLMNLHGSDPFGLGDDQYFIVTRVTYNLVDGEPDPSGLATEASIGHVGSVLVEVRPAEEA